MSLIASTITNCVSGYETLPEGVAQPTIANIYQFAGGIVGGTQVKIIISDCTNYMGISSSITGNTGFGGIIGIVNGNATGSSISNSANHGSIEASSTVGGIVGRLATKSTTAPLTLTNCLNDGVLTIGSSNATDEVGVVSASTGGSAKISGRLIGSCVGAATTYKIINE